MSIVPMAKLTLYGLGREKQAVLAGLQDLGCVHLVPLVMPEPETTAAPGIARNVYDALSYLLRTPQIRKPLRHAPDFDLDDVTKRALVNKQRQREVTDRLEFLEGRIANLRRWGHFVLPPADDLAGQRLWFYEVPHRQRHLMAGVDLTWIEVGRSHRTYFIVVIAPDEPPRDAMPVERTHTGPTSLRALEREQADAEVTLEELQLERIGLTRYIHLIQQNLARADDHAALNLAVQQTHDEAGVFAVQGWVPRERIASLRAFADEKQSALVVEPAREGEMPPTLLRNAMPAAAGEDLAKFYQIPSPRDWDPSAVLLGSFALFFAMILSDAVYGAIVLIAGMVLWRGFGRTPVKRRLRVMLMALGSAAILYGIAAGSYAGVSPPPHSLLAAAHVIDVRDTTEMMAVSIGIGVFHVVLANMAAGMRRWPDTRAFASLGWIAVAVGGFAAWRGYAVDGPVMAGVSIFHMALFAVAAGLAAVLLFRSARPIQGVGDLLRRGAYGLLGVAQVTQLFGDVLSYLRLFALGLASASLAITFNDLSVQALNSVSGVGLLLAILVAVVGHTLNFALAIVGGVVHGLRLNFIEFYNWGLSEEGYAFRPFERKELRL